MENNNINNNRQADSASSASNKQEYDHIKMLNLVTSVLSQGESFSVVFREILDEVCKFCNAEGGALYIYDDQKDSLKAVVLLNYVLGINSTVEQFNPLKIDGLISLPMKDKHGNPNLTAVSAAAAIQRRPIVIRNCDDSDEYDLVATHKFDQQNNYHTKNIMALPLIGHEETPIGVFQLINASEDLFNDDKHLRLLENFSKQVAVLLNNALLVSALEHFLLSFVHMIGMAIDEKSPHTAGHCQRVTEVTMWFAEVLCEHAGGNYKDFTLDEKQMNELRIAGLLHDLGKIITPAHILEKPTRLYDCKDRMETVLLRIQLFVAQLAVEREQVADEGRQAEIKQKIVEADQWIEFLQVINTGNIRYSPDNSEKLKYIASHHYTDAKGDKQALLDSDELAQLDIERGTLSKSERKVMEDHASITIRLLSSLPWPQNLRNITEFAGGHHENMNGTGYPNNLSADQLSIPAKLLGIADRFEGLAASDRPYRKPFRLSQVINIMQMMRQDGEIDQELLDIFLNSNIPNRYAEKYLTPDLNDIANA